MEINVNVYLAKGQTLAYAPDAAAMQVLVALGGNQTIDHCVLYTHSPVEPGTAGVPPAETPQLAPPPEPE